MSRATRATRLLEQAGVSFTVHEYHYDPDAESVGLQAAAALGESPLRVLKILQMKRVPVALEAGALVEALVYVNGGQRGLQVRLAPRAIVKLLDAAAAELVAS